MNLIAPLASFDCSIFKQNAYKFNR